MLKTTNTIPNTITCYKDVDALNRPSFVHNIIYYNYARNQRKTLIQNLGDTPQHRYEHYAKWLTDGVLKYKTTPLCKAVLTNLMWDKQPGTNEWEVYQQQCHLLQQDSTNFLTIMQHLYYGLISDNTIKQSLWTQALALDQSPDLGYDIFAIAIYGGMHAHGIIAANGQGQLAVKQGKDHQDKINVFISSLTTQLRDEDKQYFLYRALEDCILPQLGYQTPDEVNRLAQSLSLENNVVLQHICTVAFLAKGIVQSDRTQLNPTSLKTCFETAAREKSNTQCTQQIQADSDKHHGDIKGTQNTLLKDLDPSLSIEETQTLLDKNQSHINIFKNELETTSKAQEHNLISEQITTLEGLKHTFESAMQKALVKQVEEKQKQAEEKQKQAEEKARSNKRYFTGNLILFVVSYIAVIIVLSLVPSLPALTGLFFLGFCALVTCVTLSSTYQKQAPTKSWHALAMSQIILAASICAYLLFPALTFYSASIALISTIAAIVCVQGGSFTKNDLSQHAVNRNKLGPVTIELCSYTTKLKHHQRPKTCSENSIIDETRFKDRAQLKID